MGMADEKKAGKEIITRERVGKEYLKIAPPNRVEDNTNGINQALLEKI